MLSAENPNSITHQNNKDLICSNLDCHPQATPGMAQYKVHPEFNMEQSPTQYYFTVLFLALAGGTLLPLMGLMGLDLVRRLFPRAGLKRKRRK